MHIDPSYHIRNDFVYRDDFKQIYNAVESLEKLFNQVFAKDNFFDIITIPTAILKPVKFCKTIGYETNKHFRGATKMVRFGSGVVCA